MTESQANQVPRTLRSGSWAEAIPLFLVFGCFSLWDFYIGEIRIFDFLGLFVVIGTVGLLSAAGFGRSVEFDGHAIPPLAGVLALILIYSLIGVANHPDNLKPVIGILLGFIALLFGRTAVIDERLLVRAVSIVVYLHLIAFFFQLIYFYSTRDVFNFHSSLGLQPRLLSSVFRPAGLFLEPAIYCFFACSAFLLRRQMGQVFGHLDFLLLFSMGVSLSLWGLATAIILFCVFKPRMALLGLLVVVVVGAVVFVKLDFSDSVVYRFFEMRLGNLASDASAQQRFGGIFSLLDGLLSRSGPLLGGGVSNSFEGLGANGWSFILNSMGILGSAAMFAFLGLLAPPRRWLVFFFGLAILLTAAPLWKGMYLWLWIGLMIRSDWRLSRSQSVSSADDGLAT